MINTLNFRDDDGTDITLDIADLVIAGWTGRDTASLEAHIEELVAIGVPRPSSVPCFFRVSNTLLTTAEDIQALGDMTSGEVELVLYGAGDGMRVGVGSDHTDRKVEAYSIVVSKQMCLKPVSTELWRYADVADHWDELILRSWTTVGGERRLYQEGPAAAMRGPDDLLGRYLDGADQLPPGTAMFGGTLAVHGDIAPGEHFEVEVEDPVLKRSIRHAYTINALPVID